MLALTPSERRDLRARAHRLDPMVSVGRQGLTPPVLHEIDVNLLAHELVKVRVFGADRDQRKVVLARICAELEAAPVQHIGRLLVVWRPAPAPSEDHAAAGAKPKGRLRGRAAPASLQRERGRHSSPRGGSAPALSTAKSTPRARRPREPVARTPARPPATHTGRTRGQSAPGNSRRRRGLPRP